MAKNVRLTINMDEKCKKCGKKGATEGGYCLPCITKAIIKKPVKNGKRQS